MGRHTADLTGQRFGSLVVTRRAGKAAGGQALWYCDCDCGGSHTILGQSLRRGKTTRCKACIAAGRSPNNLATIAVDLWCAQPETGAIVIARDMDSGAILACSHWSRAPIKGDGRSYAALRGVYLKLAGAGRVPAKDSDESWDRWRKRANITQPKLRLYTPRTRMAELDAECEATGLRPPRIELDRGNNDRRTAAVGS